MSFVQKITMTDAKVKFGSLSLNNQYQVHFAGFNTSIINYLRNIKPDIIETVNFYIYKEIDNNLSNFWLLCYMPEVNFKCGTNRNNNYRITDIKKTRLVHAYFYLR